MLPYFTGHSINTDCALMWLNSALTYIDVIKSPKGTTYIGIVSESGQIEFFLFASMQSPKKLLKDIAIITGSAPLPPIYSLGFHYSEWAKIYADLIMGYNKKFESLGFPVDVLWIDIEYN